MTLDFRSGEVPFGLIESGRILTIGYLQRAIFFGFVLSFIFSKDTTRACCRPY